MCISARLIDKAKQLTEALRQITPEEPVQFIYNPLEYAFEAYTSYLTHYAHTKGIILLMGMNPGPDGMAQTGIPFGAVNQVSEYLRINRGVKTPPPGYTHPKKPILGFKTPRIEPSGNRLWGLFRELFPEPQDFFANHLVLNYCPLLFLNQRGANVPTDKLSVAVQTNLKPCDRAIAESIQIIEPSALVGIGNYAYQRFLRIKSEYELPNIPVYKILHPSPASPAANRGWYSQAATGMVNSGLWPAEYQVKAQLFENRIKTGR